MLENRISEFLIVCTNKAYHEKQLAAMNRA